MPPEDVDQQALDCILERIASDIEEMLMVGVSDKEGNTKKRMCTLHCVGDWQWLAKAGHLTRSYANCEKRPRAEQGVARGRCHMCQAGQDQVGWENFQLTTPAWWPTIFREDAFWGSPSPQSGCCSTRFRTGCLLHIDLFHSFHLGVGKTCVASCLLPSDGTHVCEPGQREMHGTVRNVP